MKTLVIFLLPTFLLFGQGKVHQSSASQRLQISAFPEYKKLDGNNINTTISNDGLFADYRKTNSAGMEWPKGSDKTCIFTGGMWLAGIHRPTGQIRTAIQEYSSEYQPGAISGIFNTTTNNDSLYISNARNNIGQLFKINKTDIASPSSNFDYGAWPGNLGAPYHDLNKNGVWDKDKDKPQFFGEQQIWNVCNDATVQGHSDITGSLPMGVEVQSLYIASNQYLYLSNIVFLHYLIINKSDADYDSVYWGLYSDVDLGDANDDLPGCDTLLNLGFVYNGRDVDGGNFGYGEKPPAIGFKLLKGPTVKASPNDSARIGNIWKKGYRNLPMTSFGVGTGWVLPGDPGEPIPEDYYNWIKYGFISQNSSFFLPLDFQKYRFMFSGDPIAKTGELPVNFDWGEFAPQDVRILLGSGPFTLAKQETQEILAAVLINQGEDRFKSLQKIKTLAYYLTDEEVTGEEYVEIETKKEISAYYILHQNYPNPFNPVTNIQFDLPEKCLVRLAIYDLLGRELKILVNGERTAGIHTERWQASLSSGVYFYRLEAISLGSTARQFMQVRKMLLLR